MTTAPDEPLDPDDPIAPDDTKPTEPPDPAHDTDDGPRFARTGEDDTPEVPVPDAEEGGS